MSDQIGPAINRFLREPVPRRLFFGLGCVAVAAAINFSFGISDGPSWLAEQAASLPAAGWFFGDYPSWLSVVAIAITIAGLILVAMAVAMRPRQANVLILSSAAAAIAWYGALRAWDSPRLLFGVLAVIPLVAAAVIHVPKLIPFAGCAWLAWGVLICAREMNVAQAAGKSVNYYPEMALFAIIAALLALAGVFMSSRAVRYATVTGLALFHFAGIVSAITSPPPQSWLSNWVWVTLFRPHLVFCYTNNAYQFYSPEPGPACLLWFCIERNDGQQTWFKLPRKPDTHLDPLNVEYFRRLSITESINQSYSLPNVPPAALEKRRLRQDIPFLPDVSEFAQYRLPQDNVRRSIASFVRHVAGMYGGPAKVRRIKLYRVVHQMLTPQQFAVGDDPFAKWTYWPYYLGEYDTKGDLIDPSDGTLFWLIPIIKRPPTVADIVRPGRPTPVDVDNWLLQHAGTNGRLAPDPFEE